MNVEINAVLKNPNGLHARPAAMFVQKANKYKCQIFLTSGKKEVNAKSIIGVMSLNAGDGTIISIRAVGEDALDAVKELGEYLEYGCEDESGSVINFTGN